MPSFEWCGHKGRLSARGKCARCGLQGPKDGGKAFGPVKAASGKVGGKIGGKIGGRAWGPVKALKLRKGVGMKGGMAEVAPPPSSRCPCIERTLAISFVPLRLRRNSIVRWMFVVARSP